MMLALPQILSVLRRAMLWDRYGNVALVLLACAANALDNDQTPWHPPARADDVRTLCSEPSCFSAQPAQ